MRRVKRMVIGALAGVIFLYVLGCTVYYFAQNRLLFPGTPLSPGYRFRFDGSFEERTIVAPDGDRLNGLLFKADSSKGVIFYLHGNGKNLAHWGTYAHFYTSLHYDVFFLDYRGYGKSEGAVSGEAQMFGDVQAAYEDLRKSYPDTCITVLGYSIGTGPAAMLAARNHPHLLILQAPYYSIQAMSTQYVPGMAWSFPSFLLKYRFETFRYLQETKAPVVIFHGDRDRVIHIEQSYRLKAYLKPGDLFIELPGQGHDRFTDNVTYLQKLKEILDASK